MNRSRFFAHRAGVAGLEFALVTPVLLLMVLILSDTVLWMRTWLRMEQTTAELSQIVTQYQTLYTSDFTAALYPIAETGVGSASLICSTGGMVVTGISNASGTPTVTWQWTSGSCAASAYTSGTTPALPGSYTPPSGLSMIVVELTTTQPDYVFSAGLMASAGLSAIHTYAVVMPRAGTLPTYTSGTRPSS